ncbi:hypothetical protein M0812_15100 [Anaeramoeba flamelloides]|uniref:Uncharacterized protein n=1 Tax=Anaeramoeba flamelloides TaxID=1746091 RepID=A0AAV7ZB23_9EUKA|nr:hypothetical protein M0812_15100 [Anaeramoeba flamelloides]
MDQKSNYKKNQRSYKGKTKKIQIKPIQVAIPKKHQKKTTESNPKPRKVTTKQALPLNVDLKKVLLSKPSLVKHYSTYYPVTKLLNSRFEWVGKQAFDFLSKTNKNYTVISAIGKQGVGKSTVLKALCGEIIPKKTENDLELEKEKEKQDEKEREKEKEKKKVLRKPKAKEQEKEKEKQTYRAPLTIQPNEMIKQAGNQTSGVDLCINSNESILLLDSQAIDSPSILTSMLKSPLYSSSELGSLLNRLKIIDLMIAVWLMTISDLLIVIQDTMVDFETITLVKEALIFQKEIAKKSLQKNFTKSLNQIKESNRINKEKTRKKPQKIPNINPNEEINLQSYLPNPFNRSKIVFVINKAENELFSESTHQGLSSLISKMFQEFQNVETQVYLIPKKKNDYHKNNKIKIKNQNVFNQQFSDYHNGFKSEIKNFSEFVLSKASQIRRNKHSQNHLKKTEYDWLKFSTKLREKISQSDEISKLKLLLQKKWKN